MKSADRVIQLTQRLIRIKSENPPGDEADVGRFIRMFLKRSGYTPKIYEFAARRMNVVCSFKSKESQKRVLLSPHIDTVPAGENWLMPAFKGKIYNRRIYGRGASDCKGNCAVAMEVMAQLQEGRIPLNGLDVIFAATADEETGSSLGFQPLLPKLLPLDFALVLDGKECEIFYGQKGLLHLRVRTEGKKAHGATPYKGENAIIRAVNIYGAIKKQLYRLARENKHNKYTVNIGKVEGGEKVNVVADKCCMDLDIRFTQEQTLKSLCKDLKNAASKVTKKFTFETLTFQGPVTVTQDNELGAALKKSLRKNNLPVRFRISNGATVLNFLAEKKVPSFIFGFASGNQAHVSNEYIEVSRLKQGVAVLKDILISLDNLCCAESKKEAL